MAHLGKFLLACASIEDAVTDRQRTCAVVRLDELVDGAGVRSPWTEPSTEFPEYARSSVRPIAAGEIRRASPVPVPPRLDLLRNAGPPPRWWAIPGRAYSTPGPHRHGPCARSASDDRRSWAGVQEVGAEQGRGVLCRRRRRQAPGHGVSVPRGELPQGPRGRCQQGQGWKFLVGDRAENRHVAELLRQFRSVSTSHTRPSDSVSARTDVGFRDVYGLFIFRSQPACCVRPVLAPASHAPMMDDACRRCRRAGAGAWVGRLPCSRTKRPRPVSPRAILLVQR